MNLIVRGEPHEVDFVRRLCRDKVLRGVLTLLPPSDPVSDIAELKKERDEIARQIDGLSGRLTELKERVASISVPVEIGTDIKEPIAMDNKYIDIEDLHKVDLDSDDKAIVTDDFKDIQTVDVKEEITGRKTSKRSKKSE